MQKINNLDRGAIVPDTDKKQKQKRVKSEIYPHILGVKGVKKVMFDIEYQIFKDILNKTQIQIGFERFALLHQYICARSLDNYLYRDMQPTRKKFNYVINCLKAYHEEEYKQMIREIEDKYKKPLEKILKDSIITSILDEAQKRAQYEADKSYQLFNINGGLDG